MSQSQKNWKGFVPLVSFGFAKARRSCWLKQGFEGATAGFPPNRLTNLCFKKLCIQGERQHSWWKPSAFVLSVPIHCKLAEIKLENPLKHVPDRPEQLFY